MIILILIIAVLLFSLSMIFQPIGHWRNVTIILSFILMAVSILVISLNDNHHLGMQQTTKVENITLAPTHQLLARRLGTGPEKSYLYTTSFAPKKIQHTPISNTTSTRIDRTAKSDAHLQITTKRWQYRNGLWHALLSVGGENNQLASRQYLFTIPKSWSIRTRS